MPNSTVERLCQFLDASPTPQHASWTLASALEDAGFTRVDPSDLLPPMPPGFRGFTVKSGTCIAWVVGTAPIAASGFRAIAAHTDSPNLRIKPEADVYAHGYHQLAVEPYGGVLLHTWFDRDLSLAGRVTLKSGVGTETRLVDFARPLLRVPNLAIHLYREINSEGLKLNAQRHLAPLLGLGDDGAFADLLCAEIAKEGAMVEREDVLAWDLMAYDTQPCSVSGADGEFIHAPRLDNLASSHAGLSALTTAGEHGASSATRVVVLYDHEEVGSRSTQGAGGTFLEDTLRRVANAAGGGADAMERAVSRSWLVSADMAHAVHPNYADRHEPGHRPKIGQGPVIKTNSNQAYATDAESAGFFSSLCARIGVTPQNFVTRSDLGCGSTIGPISAARVGIRTVDVGNPMLSMHSCREMAGSADVGPMIDVLVELFRGD